MRKIFITLLGLLAFLPMTFAAYFTNVPQVRVQPNGDTLRCFATGDEYFHRLHDADGYTIVLNPTTGYYVYADKVGDKLVPTAYVAGRVNPAEVGLTANLCISAEQWTRRRAQREMATPVRAGMRDGQANHGHINNLVVFIRFADDYPFTNSLSEVDAMFNDSIPGNMSMYNYFKSATYNKLAITSTFYPTQSGSVILSYQDIYNRNYYEPYSSVNPSGYDPDDDYERTEREHQLLARAVNYIANMVPTSLDIDYDNDGYVDNIVFVVRGDVGNWNDLLWPHRWALYSESAYINNLRVWDFNFQLADATSYFNAAVLCHEMNHSLGAPDLYHYYDGTDLAPVGIWDLMAQTAYPPQHMGAYMKYKYGHWIDSIPEITECGTYSLHSVGSSETNNCYRIASPNPNEFFVLEYRNSSDFFETSLPSSGLLIYRINSSFGGNAMWNGVDVFDEVYVYRPNGTTTNDGNSYSAAFSEGSGRTEFSANTNPQPFLTDGTVLEVGDFIIRNISAAGGDSMTFKFCSSEYLQVLPDQLTLDADSGSASSVLVSSDMAWTISGECEWLSYTPVSDSGHVTVLFTALSENTLFEMRSCVITITASNGDQQTVVVSQRGQQPYLEAAATDPVLGTAGVLYGVNSTCHIEISSNVAWHVVSDVDWIGFSQTEGEGNSSISAIALAANPTCIRRYGMLSLLDDYGHVVNIQIVQMNLYDGMLSVTPTTLTIDNAVGATNNLLITATDAWNVSNLPSWLSATPTEGDATVYNVVLTATSTNSSTTPRTASVLISDICGRTDSQVQIMVTQPEGYLSLSDPSVTIGPEQGNSRTVAVTCSGGWNVVASTVPEWLSVSPTSANGNTNVTLTALSDNPDGDARTAVVRFRYTLNFAVELIVIQQPASGIIEVSEVSTLLYPNPVNDLLIVDIEGASQYTVFDAAGRSVLYGDLTDMENTISFAGLENGIYFVRYADKKTGKTAVAKVVKR